MEQMVPTVSVVMPTYNQDAYLLKAVRSVLDQDFGAFELIVVNDGSTDRTAALLDEISDPRVRVIHQANGGAAAAVNRGVREARGRFVTWVSSDNIHAPWFLSAHLGALAAYPEAGFAYSAFHLMDEADGTTGLVAFNHLAQRDLILGINTGGCVGFLYRRELHDAIGYFDETARVTCDNDFWERTLGRVEAVYVVEPTCWYRLHDASGTSTLSHLKIQEIERTLARNLARIWSGELMLPRLYGMEAGSRDLMFSMACNFAAKTAAATGDRSMAAKFYELALSMTPRRHLLEGLAAYVGACAENAGDEVRAGLAAGLGRNPNFTGQEVAAAVSLAMTMLSLARITLEEDTSPLASLDCAPLNTHMLRTRKTYSHLSATFKPGTGS